MTGDQHALGTREIIDRIFKEPGIRYDSDELRFDVIPANPPFAGEMKDLLFLRSRRLNWQSNACGNVLLPAGTRFRSRLCVGFLLPGGAISTSSMGRWWMSGRCMTAPRVFYLEDGVIKERVPEVGVDGLGPRRDQ